jgi:fluoroacetyl-CoA thioesterase
MTHTAATPVGMQVTAEVKLVGINDRILRFKVACRDEKDPIGEGFHERTIIDNARFMARLARKTGG